MSLSSPPVSVVVVTKNEERNIEHCLNALDRFDDVFVVDSQSDDETLKIVQQFDVTLVDFQWNGQYPKKRGWCLQTLDFKYDWVFFVDADEFVHPFLIDEILMLDLEKQEGLAGFFVPGQYVLKGQLLQHGVRNQKIALFHRDHMAFPVVDDLDLEGMGEIEGHYQPVLKEGFEGCKIGQLHYPVLHYAFSDEEAWEARHERYARWEAGMNAKNAWPQDPKPVRQFLKVMFRTLPFRGLLAFWYSFIWKKGFLDGQAGRFLAQSRKRYYEMISNASKTQGT